MRKKALYANDAADVFKRERSERGKVVAFTCPSSQVHLFTNAEDVAKRVDVHDDEGTVHFRQLQLPLLLH